MEVNSFYSRVVIIAYYAVSRMSETCYTCPEIISAMRYDCERRFSTATVMSPLPHESAITQVDGFRS